MAQYQPLTAEEIQEIAGRFYAQRAPKTRELQTPTMVLVAGQPGAGKSAASYVAREELKSQGGFIHVDADRMRERIDTRGTTPTSQETQVDAGALARELRRLAVDGRRNVIEEGTFRVPEQVESVIAAQHARGARVELLAVATPREESILGIYQRHEAQHLQGSLNPRFVPEGYHDDAMDGFARTVAQVGHQFDRVRIIDRQGEIQYDSAAAEHDLAPIEALTKRQQITDERLAEVAASWTAVRAHAEQRAADPTYLAAIAQNANDVLDTQKGRIHFHALRQHHANVATLDRDPRFAAHSDDELSKVAYYRGFHQKAFAFAGKSTDFVAFDSTMTDRNNARKLPDVVEIEGRPLQRSQRHHASTRGTDVDRSL